MDIYGACCHTPLYMLPIQISSSPISLPLTIVLYLCITVCNTRVLIYVQIIPNTYSTGIQGPTKAKRFCQPQLPKYQPGTAKVKSILAYYSCIFSIWVRVKDPRTYIAYINR